MEYKNLSKKELVKLFKDIESLLNGDLLPQNNSAINNTSNQENNLLTDNNYEQRNDLENLIGTIPFLLLNQKIFEKNQDIADFAENLGIHIPSPEKKKREDMIGRVVSAIARFDNKMIADLNVAIKSLKKTDIKKGKFNFFRDWEIAIKQMKL